MHQIMEWNEDVSDAVKAELAENIRTFDEDKYKTGVEIFLKGKGCVEDGHATERVCDLIESKL